VRTRSQASRFAALASLGIVLAIASAGCTASALVRQRRADTASDSRPLASRTRPARLTPLWLQTLTMISAQAGWAIGWTGNPNSRSPVTMALFRTTDGGHAWTGVTPPAARSLLASSNSYPIIYPTSASTAWFAATLERSESNYGVTPHRTRVFETTDAGRTWAESTLIRAPGNAGWLSQAGRSDGWLLQNLGAAMGQNHVQLYRSTDAGRRWSLIAETHPWGQSGTSTTGLTTDCDKTGITFTTRHVGFITAVCVTATDPVLRTSDGGTHWSPEPLPIPAGACQECSARAPQFFGPAGFMAVGSYPGPGYLLASHDSGATWQVVPLPPGAGPYPMATFFNARDGVLIPAGPQESFGQDFYVTSDGGLTWRPVRQGAAVRQFGTIQFVTPTAGFAENLNQAYPLLYATANDGRSWTRFVPLN
jgi:photosystem II stability/assembly factor-like uncharacterized protein